MFSGGIEKQHRAVMGWSLVEFSLVTKNIFLWLFQNPLDIFSRTTSKKKKKV